MIAGESLARGESFSTRNRTTVMLSLPPAAFAASDELLARIAQTEWRPEQAEQVILAEHRGETIAAHEIHVSRHEP